MAWNDGSRFLIAHGVKWGTGPKFYKGSKHDTYWNKDLLWKLYVQGEARKHGVAIRTEANRNDLEVIPPFMKSLEAARRRDGNHVPFDDPYRDDLFKTNTKSARTRPIIDRTKAGHTARSRHGTARGGGKGGVPLASSRSRRRGLGSGVRPGSSSSLRSAGAGISSPAASNRSGRTTGRTAARLAALERMIAEEGARRRDLEGQLQNERHLHEKEMAQLRQELSGAMRRGESTATSEAKIKAYDAIMSGLVTALKKSGGGNKK